MLLPAPSLHDACTSSYYYLVLLRFRRVAPDESDEVDGLAAHANVGDRVRTPPHAAQSRGDARAVLDRASRSHAVEWEVGVSDHLSVKPSVWGDKNENRAADGRPTHERHRVSSRPPAKGAADDS